MHSRRSVIVVASVALLVGAVGGAVLGFEVATRVCHRMFQPVLVASGNQAYTVLTLLDRDEDSRLREQMETEIDATLLLLKEIEARGPFEQGDPTALVAERLRKYRADHPRNAVQSSEERIHAAEPPTLRMCESLLTAAGKRANFRVTLRYRLSTDATGRVTHTERIDSHEHAKAFIDLDQVVSCLTSWQLNGSENYEVTVGSGTHGVRTVYDISSRGSHWLRIVDPT